MLVLLAAVTLVVVPHFEHLPWWATAVVALLLFWRVWLTIAQRPLPGRFIMLPLLLAAAGAVYLQHRTLAGQEAGVTFLLLLMALKLLEMRARRDIFVVIFLSFFILLTQFLYGQGLPVAMITVAAVIALFFVLVSVNLDEVDLPAARKLRLVGLTLAKAVPLTVALFVLFPRFSGPLWGMPGESGRGSTGLSNSMSPGSISRLLESDEIAFRVSFEGAAPGNDKLYWRGPVFGTYTGRTWLPLASRTVAPELAIEADRRSAVTYTVTLEPHKRDWLFALEAPGQLPTLALHQARLMPDMQLLAGDLITSRVRYDMTSYTSYRLDANLDAAATAGLAGAAERLQPTHGAIRTGLARPGPARRGERALRARRPARQCGAGTLPAGWLRLHAGAAGARTQLDRRLPVRHATRILRALRIGLRVPDARTGRSGACRHRLPGRRTESGRRLHDGAAVRRPCMDRSLAPGSGLGACRSDRRRGAGAHTGWCQRDCTAGGPGPDGSRNGCAMAACAALQLGSRAEQLEPVGPVVFAGTPAALVERLGLAPRLESVALVLALVMCILLAWLAFVSLRPRLVRDPLGASFQLLRERLERAGVAASVSCGPRELYVRTKRALVEDDVKLARRLLSRYEQLRYGPVSAHATRADVRSLRRAIRAFRPRPNPL